IDGAGILVNSSRDTQVIGNTVKNNNDGIGLVESGRANGLRNITVKNNTVTLRSGALNGAVATSDSAAASMGSWNLVFDGNRYSGGGGQNFAWGGSYISWDAWRAAGQDPSGSFNCSLARHLWRGAPRPPPTGRRRRPSPGGRRRAPRTPRRPPRSLCCRAGRPRRRSPRQRRSVRRAATGTPIASVSRPAPDPGRPPTRRPGALQSPSARSSQRPPPRWPDAPRISRRGAPARRVGERGRRGRTWRPRGRSPGRRSRTCRPLELRSRRPSGATAPRSRRP